MKQLFCILLINVTFLAYTQEKKIFYGQLLDSSTQAPIHNAHVLSSSKGATISDYHGNFSIYVLGDDTLTVSCIGYQKTNILVSNYKNFENNKVIFQITPIIYTLSSVEIPYAYSVVIVPMDKKEKVNIEGVAPLKNEIWHKKVNDDINIKFQKENNIGKSEVPELQYFGIGVTIDGFLSGLINKETKKERDTKEVIENDKRTSFFDTYMKSDELKNILMSEPYNMSQNEYKNFVEIFILKAGKIKFATNEYDILQEITKNLKSNK
ncbi:MAG: carboxypeptidase-like regulatory domain-containing protein [Bacteroidales bacterium]|jgi:hypothetical protein|nr:carboxypeptidase-like regulatory domain-containing protein [Bacteroidales bacterium]